MFGNDKPKISDDELKRTKEELYSKGLNKHKLDQVEKVFHGHMDEPGKDRGIDAGEITAGAGYMREHKKDLGVTDKDINDIEKSMRKRL